MAEIVELRHTVAEGFSLEPFEGVVERYQDMVYGLALHSLRDGARAEEIAQDVFLRLYEDRGRIQSEDHLKFWLRRVTTTRCVDEARRRKFTRTENLADVAEPGAWEARPDSALMERVWAAVGGLPEAARAMVILRYQEDLDPGEISRILEIPVATVKSRLFRSLQAVRGRLEKAGVLVERER